LIPVSLTKLELFDPLEMSPVPCEKRQAVGESDSSDQAVTHSNGLADQFKLTANLGSQPRGGTIEW
jgi:hypothetical protein